LNGEEKQSANLILKVLSPAQDRFLIWLIAYFQFQNQKNKIGIIISSKYSFEWIEYK
jgi:hypothetical protein